MSGYVEPESLPEPPMVKSGYPGVGSLMELNPGHPNYSLSDLE